MNHKSRWYLLLSGAMAFILSNAFSIFQESQQAPARRWWLLLAVTISIISHFTTLLVIARWTQHQFPGLFATQKRILRSVLYGTFAVSILIFLTDIWQQTLRGTTTISPGLMVVAGTLFQGLAITIFVVGGSEAIYHYGELQRSEKEKEELLRLNLMAHYDSLKQQVNPHFLFNSLNTLSALITSHPENAEKFVEELSVVYRYLLQSSQEELTTLDRELRFIQSYLHLLTTRFGQSLRVEIAVHETARGLYILPLTLQLLVENAVKHNEISAENPLFLTIKSIGNQLEVRNNIQKRSIALPSEKVGLANIIARYRLMGHPDVEVQDTGTAFIVTLPLILPAQRKNSLPHP